ncbi:MAG: terminase large subunit domain-containing protein [Armatimonadota bacterium]
MTTPRHTEPRALIPLTPDDEALALVLGNPVVWGEHFLRNRDGAPRSYWSHQIDDLLCTARNVIHLDGRDVGKSVNLTTDALHFGFTSTGKQGLIAAPHQGHLDALIEEIEFQLDANPALMESVGINSYGKPKIIRKPYFRIEFKNGSILYFRPAGVYGDAFRSLHVERVWVDEGAWLTEAAWKALRQCLKANGTLRIYSTPNGLRTTTYYRLTHSEQFRVFRWPSSLNPLWTDDRARELAEFYGGRDSAGWQHEVVGEHGKPAYGAFDQEQFLACREDILEYRKVIITGDDLHSCTSDADTCERLEVLLAAIPQSGVFWLGGDLGYTNDPTELVLFREFEEAERPVLQMVLRLHLERVAYPQISMLLALLDRYFSPTGIGVDNGGNGGAVVQELLTLDAFKTLQLQGRLRGIDFGGVTTLVQREGIEVRKRTKELMTNLINGLLLRRQLRFPLEDQELADQFCTHTYTLSNSYVVYSKGNDHIIDAVRCAVLARELLLQGDVREEMVSLLPVTTAPIFI